MSGRKAAYEGPYYVCLGGDKAGIFKKLRPPQTALGSYKPLLPVVVICSAEKDAEAINKLNKHVFNHCAPDDNHRMVYMLRQQPATDISLSVSSPIYCIRSGEETGVYIGFPWTQLNHFVADFKPKGQAAWSGSKTISEALIYMVSKPGYNLPLVPPGQELPPPPEPEECDGDAHDTGDEGGDNYDDEYRGAPAARSTSAERSREVRASRRVHRPSPVKSSRAPSRPTSPVKPSREASISTSPVKTSHNAPPPSSPIKPSRSTHKAPVSPSAVSSPHVKASSSRSGHRHRSRHDDGPSSARREEPDDDLATALRDSLRFQGPRDALRSIVRPPPTMEQSYMNPRGLAISFGPDADRVLFRAGVTAEELLMLFRVRVHCDTIESFTYHLSLNLKWKAQICKELWEVMDFPLV